MPAIEIGVSLPSYGDLAPGGFPGVVEGARHAEEAGLDSVSVCDFIMGNGVPALDAPLLLAAAAGVTERVGLRFSVLTLPVRDITWVAQQVGTLQQLSGGRVVLGVGTGGAPGTPFWEAVGASGEERGRRFEEGLALLPRLLSGRETALPHRPGEAAVTLSPPAEVPPVLVGGASERAIRRAGALADGWLPSMVSPATVARGTARLREIAAEHGRPAPATSVWLHAGLGDGESVTSARAAFLESLVKQFGLAADEAAEVPIGGTPEEAAERFTAYAEAGATHLDLVVDGGDWRRQVELIAEARALLGK
ncbi:LLM class flavin-dependent oxidoreductase [Streptomyces sp. NPDC001985]|uniref:LLM class flavin-dependent oxidoreductase n=1 Tax=Streptomyces sp. NPDC001985 TaxID=3154406 RepID=UPI00331BD66A